MDKYKKYFQLTAIVVVAVWIFCIVFVVCYQFKSTSKDENVILTTTQAVIETFTTAESTTAAETTVTETQTVPFVSIEGNNVTTSVSASTPQWKLDEENSTTAEETTTAVQAVVPTEKKDIVAAYIAAVNQLKSTEDFTLEKTNKFSIVIDDVTGGSLVRNTVQSIVDEKTDETPKSYVFSAGKTSDGTTPNDVIAPLGKNASISASDVVSATAKADSNGGYTITLNLGTQKQTLNSDATGYATTMEVLSLDSLGLSKSLSVSSMDITYGNSSITAQIDESGRITSMKHYLEVTESYSEGKLALVSATLKMHGSLTSSYKITY